MNMDTVVISHIPTVTVMQLYILTREPNVYSTVAENLPQQMHYLLLFVLLEVPKNHTWVKLKISC